MKLTGDIRLIFPRCVSKYHAVISARVAHAFRSSIFRLYVHAHVCLRCGMHLPSYMGITLLLGTSLHTCLLLALRIRDRIYFIYDSSQWKMSVARPPSATWCRWAVLLRYRRSRWFQNVWPIVHTRMLLRPRCNAHIYLIYLSNSVQCLIYYNITIFFLKISIIIF
jgi:hypothetical protein